MSSNHERIVSISAISPFLPLSANFVTDYTMQMLHYDISAKCGMT